MRNRILAVIVAAAAFAGACGGGSDDPEPTGDDITTDDADAAATSSSTPGSSSTSTLAPAGPPTTRGPAPLVEVEPLVALGGVRVLNGEPLYTGIFGQIDVSRNVVAPVALPPAPAPAGVAPLSGLPAPGVELDRPAIMVKIDNTEKGRPQEALSQADIVYVVMVENGITRLAAVFHSQEPEVFGPVRSGRTSDIAIFASLSEPILAYSGANLLHHAVIRRFDMVDLGAGTRREYFRSPSRPGTYDLMTIPADLWSIAEDLGQGGVPLPHFEYRDATVSLPPTATPASQVVIDYPGATSQWDWDGPAGGWARTHNGTPHIDADDVRVVASNVVIAEVGHVRTGSFDTAGTAVYEEQFLGTGRGWVVTDGHIVEVIWTKPSLDSVATWTTPDGIPVPLVPGQTWVELAPVGSVSIS